MKQVDNKSKYNVHWISWPVAMAKDCGEAKEEILLSALSMHIPRSTTASSWKNLFMSFVHAAERGVKVKIWLPASHRAYPATLQNNSVASRLAEHRIEVILLTGSRLLHAKTCTIDKRVVWIGSGNFTAAAANHNYESYARIESSSMAKNMLDKLEQLK